MARGRREGRVRVIRRVAVGAAVVVALVCVGVPVAVAAPSGGYSVFAQCPTGAHGVDGCLYASLEGGYMTFGRMVLPISRTAVLQAGLLDEMEPFVKHLAGALNGETLTKVGQDIPGLAGALYAVAELAAPASSVSVVTSGGNVRLALPLKIRLEPALGSECLIGSDAYPIEMYLTSATSGALSGNPGRQTTLEEGGILLKSGVTLVDGGFAAPRVSGCGTPAVEGIIDTMLGLPSTSASAKLDAKMEIANSELVEEAEG
jgi:hypothetical protein